jgi:uncharacterized membrane protein YeiH
MLGTFLTAFDWFGIAVFAVTGALVGEQGARIIRQVFRAGITFFRDVIPGGEP